MKGELIKDVETICRLASEGKAVIYRGARLPAAFIQNFQARFLQNELDNKLIYHYKKKINVKPR